MFTSIFKTLINMVPSQYPWTIVSDVLLLPYNFLWPLGL